MKYNVAILKNESAYDHKAWVRACETNNQISSFKIIDLSADDWLIQLQSHKFDLALLRPPGQLELFKRLYDERVFLIANILGICVYPSPQEVFIYENKRFLRDWLNCNGIPHPATFVSFNKSESLAFMKTREEFPLIAKTNIGASGDGVRILKDKKEAFEYVSKAFGKGIGSRSGPKVFKGSILKKLKKALTKKDFIKQRVFDYKKTALQKQRGFLLFQEFIPHSFEWRCVRIGDSFFAHKKIAKNNKSSGTLIKGYEPVPESLLNFIREVSNKTNLISVAIDVFESKGSYLVNEVQCFFGQSDPYQMLVDDKPGRYLYKNGHWVFEEGMFNTNESYDLRLKHALSILSQVQNK